MANSRFGSDIIQLQPQFHKVPLRVESGEFLGSYTLVGVKASDGLAQEAAGTGYTRIYVAYEEFQAPDTEEGWAKYETVDNVILKLHQDGSIGQEHVGTLCSLGSDAVTVVAGDAGDIVGEVTEYISDDYVRVHIRSFNTPVSGT